MSETWRALTHPVAALTAAVALLVPALGSAQSLAEIARKEQERRKQIETPARVYTNDDLQGGGTVTGPAEPTPGAQRPFDAAQGRPAPGQAAAPPAAAPAPPPEPDPEDPRRTEEYWRERITAARQQLARSQLFLEALESRVNGLWADFTARDDPAQRAVIEQDRQKALAEMDRVRAEIERYTQEIADIEEEARRAGVPPGWLR